MSDQGTAPAVEELLDELDAIEQEAERKDPADHDITEKALQMATDFKVDLDEVKGTGTNGRITVPDVDAYIKSREAAKAEQVEAKATAKSDSEGTSKEPKGEPAPATKKVAKKKTSALAAPLLPTLREGLVEIRHMKRTLHESGGEWDQEVVNRRAADEKIGEFLQAGWALVHVEAMGVTAEGIEMLWIMGKPAEGIEFPFQEIYHNVKNVGGIGADGHGLSGLHADALINSYLAEGWELAYTKVVATSAAGINIMWVLVR